MVCLPKPAVAECAPPEPPTPQVEALPASTASACGPGLWHQYLLHVKFSTNAGVGFQETYRDGQLVLPKTSSKYANMTTPKAYLKIGMYRKGTNNGPMVVWHDDMAVYTSPPTISATTGDRSGHTTSIQVLPAGQPDDIMLTGHVN